MFVTEGTGCEFLEASTFSSLHSLSYCAHEVWEIGLSVPLSLLSLPLLKPPFKHSLFSAPTPNPSGFLFPLPSISAPSELLQEAMLNSFLGAIGRSPPWGEYCPLIFPLKRITIFSFLQHFLFLMNHTPSFCALSYIILLISVNAKTSVQFHHLP